MPAVAFCPQRFGRNPGMVGGACGPGPSRWRRGLALAAFAWALAAGGRAQTPMGEPLQIYFPPSLPPLAASRPVPGQGGAGASAPPGLADYVAEPFYAPLSTRLAKGEVGDDLAFRLATYRQRRAALRAELEASLYTAKNLEAGARDGAVHGFAREQTPRIVILEKEAESLRAALSEHTGGLAEYRRWIRGWAASPTAALSPARRLQLIQIAEFYWRGFSPAQRRLLAGIAVGLQAEVGEAKPEGSLLDFSPAPARIRLPNPLAPELAERVDAYRKIRTRVEAELLGSIFPARPYGSEFARAVALEVLAAAQERTLAGLETAAEAIRQSLAGSGDPAASPELSEFPPEIAAAVAAYRRDKLALNKALLARRDQVILEGPSTDGATTADRVQRAITEFTQQNAARFAALERRREAIRAQLAGLPGGGSGSADALLANFSNSLRRLQTSWDYRDYQAAVLQIGLSPEQRRLLLGAATEALALPLPENELGLSPP